ncbi:GAF domain-containing protein [Deinococcus ruber]|uniref:GAF domain-containing protein n=1 Tax=Deinococcus ruber TaxID=1848197 RepID=A0A918KXM6_9DEIO|nr:GAF domain-containing protein [Deinococcus ruber]GGR41312.1 hypothetical protein GCM10008957_56680 [Deinococcus ruber]
MEQGRHWRPNYASERALSFCTWTILQDTSLFIQDARLDPRFCTLPGVAGEPGIRRCAGAPLTTPEGHRIGTLCVMDTEPLPLSAAALQALSDLADTVVSELELRLHTL